MSTLETLDRLIQSGYSPQRLAKLTNFPMGVIYDRFRLQPARASQWNIPALKPREITQIPAASQEIAPKGNL